MIKNFIFILKKADLNNLFMNCDDDEDDLLSLATQKLKYDQINANKSIETSPIVVSQTQQNILQSTKLKETASNKEDHDDLIDLDMFMDKLKEPLLSQETPQVSNKRTEASNKENVLFVHQPSSTPIRPVPPKSTSSTTHSTKRDRMNTTTAANLSCVGMTQALNLINNTILNEGSARNAANEKRQQLRYFNMATSLFELFGHENDAEQSNSDDDDDLNGIDWNDIKKLETSINKSSVGIKGKKEESVLFDKSLRCDDEIFEIRTRKV